MSDGLHITRECTCRSFDSSPICSPPFEIAHIGNIEGLSTRTHAKLLSTSALVRDLGCAESTTHPFFPRNSRTLSQVELEVAPFVIGALASEHFTCLSVLSKEKNCVASVVSKNNKASNRLLPRRVVYSACKKILDQR